MQRVEIPAWDIARINTVTVSAFVKFNVSSTPNNSNLPLTRSDVDFFSAGHILYNFTLGNSLWLPRTFPVSIGCIIVYCFSNDFVASAFS